MTESDMFSERAASARREAEEAVLDNVRDRALRSAAAWQAMADRSRSVGEHRERNEARKAEQALLP